MCLEKFSLSPSDLLEVDIDVLRLQVAALLKDKERLFQQLERMAHSDDALALAHQQLQADYDLLLTAFQAATGRCVHALAGFCLGSCPGRNFCKTDGLQVLDYPGLDIYKATVIHAGCITEDYHACQAHAARDRVKGGPLET